jgi:hypothetical protein
MSSAAPRTKPAADAEPSSKRVKTGQISHAAPRMDDYDEGEQKSGLSHSSKPFVPPSDWPADGPINLRAADLPHDSADTEVNKNNTQHNKTDKRGGKEDRARSIGAVSRCVLRTMLHSHLRRNAADF